MTLSEQVKAVSRFTKKPHQTFSPKPLAVFSLLYASVDEGSRRATELKTTSKKHVMRQQAFRTITNSNQR